MILTAGHDPTRIDILHHLMDSPTFLGMDLSRYHITKHIWMLWIASAALIIFMNIAARQKGAVPRGLRNFVEPILLFIRDEVAKPNLHDDADRFLPYLWSLFFFVLFCNLLGLLPGGATATANLSVTAALAVVSFFAIHFAGIRRNGLVHYLQSIVPRGAVVALAAAARGRGREHPDQAVRAGRSTLGQHERGAHRAFSSFSASSSWWATPISS